jgi:hypothetical protein
MAGADDGVTVKLEPAVAWRPPTVTTTGPVVALLGTSTVIEVALHVVLVGSTAIPLKVTVLEPCVAPKFVPLIVTEVPTAPEVTDRPVMVGGSVNVTPLLARPATVTTTGPVVAPVGTGTTIEVAPQLVGVAATPLNVTVLVPCVAPKFVPLIVTEVPTAPEAGDSPLILGATVTVKVTPLLARPAAVTTTGPVVAAEGTVTPMLVAVQLLIFVAAAPLKVTVPCVEPKLLPAMVTDVPTGPEVGESELIDGAGALTVKVTPLLATPPAVTTTGPVVAAEGTVAPILFAVQLPMVAAAPLKVTVP